MNRITPYLEEPPEEQYGDFYVVAGDFGRVGVTHAVARRIQAVLDRWIVPTWIEFPDRVGSTVRVRTCQIRSFIESTVEQRARDRRLERAREEEEKGNRRPWEDD
jgi:hypothetical protein